MSLTSASAANDAELRQNTKRKEQLRETSAAKVVDYF